MSVVQEHHRHVDACSAPLTIAIVASSPITRTGLTTLLTHTLNFVVVGEAASRAQLEVLLQHQAPQVVLACQDAGLQLTSSEVAQLVKGYHPTSKVLILCSSTEPTCPTTLIAAGIDGQLPLTVEPDMLVKVIRDVQVYGFVLDAGLLASLRTTPPNTSGTPLPTTLPAVSATCYKPWRMDARSRRLPPISTSASLPSARISNICIGNSRSQIVLPSCGSLLTLASS